MKLRTLVLAISTALAMLVFPCGQGLAHAAKSSSLQPATSIISDTFPMSGGGTGTYAVQSDGSGPYLNGTDNVSSGVNVNWVLDLTTSATRTASVSLTSGVSGNTPPPGIQTSGQLKLQVDCFRVTGADMLTMGVGTITCPALIRLPLINKLTYYVLEMAELSSETETTRVQVQCNTVVSGECTDWYVDPIGTIYNSDGSITPGQATARLNYVTSKGTTNAGDFYLTFHYHITR